jgi:hypothetical protein
MDPLKAEFIQLVELMGWNHSEAGRQLHMSHVAVGKLMNPLSATRPRPTTLHLLKYIVSAAKPEAFNLKTMEVKPDVPSFEELTLINALRTAPPELRDSIKAVLDTMLGGSLRRAKARQNAPRSRLNSGQIHPVVEEIIDQATVSQRARGDGGSAHTGEPSPVPPAIPSSRPHPERIFSGKSPPRKKHISS